MVRTQRVALVTGANKGIGFEVARQLRREGFHVFLGDRNTKAGLAAVEKLQAEVGHAENKTGVELIEIDIANPASVKHAAEEFSKKSDRLDALINNAGILLDDDKE